MEAPRRRGGPPPPAPARMAVYIKLAGAGAFVEVAVPDGATISGLAKLACAENRCWGVGASQVELVLVAEGGGPPAEATVARALADAGAVQPVNAPAGGLAGAWLVARVIKRATPRAPLRGAAGLLFRAGGAREHGRRRGAGGAGARAHRERGRARLARPRHLLRGGLGAGAAAAAGRARAAA